MIFFANIATISDMVDNSLPGPEHLHAYDTMGFITDISTKHVLGAMRSEHVHTERLR